MKKLLLIALLALGVGVANSQVNLELNLEKLAQGVDSAIILLNYEMETMCSSHYFKIKDGKVVDISKDMEGVYPIFESRLSCGELRIDYIFWKRKREVHGSKTKKLLCGYDYTIEPEPEKKNLNIHYYYFKN